MGPEVHHGWQPIAIPIQLGPGGVDAKPWQGLTAIHLEIGGGPAQFTPQASAPHHPSLKAVGPAQQGFGGGEVGLVEGRADAAAAHPALLVFNDRHHLHLNAAASRQPFQHFGVTAPLMTEAEVGAHGNAPGLKCVQQHAGDEVLRTQLSELAGEGHQHELLDPQGFEQSEFFAG